MIKQDHFFKLSILLVTYNHEKYISKALDSLFHQVLEGPIELVVADDASTDNTIALIKAYEGKDPRFHFKYLPNASNLGITKNYQRGFAACSGEYVAVLEGDDYWIKPDKLKKQCDFLDLNWACNLCFVNYFIYKEDIASFELRVKDTSGTTYISARALIEDNIIGNFSTCMYRREALLRLPEELFELCSYDWITNICIAETSIIGFLKEPMSVYRLHNSGAWSQKQAAEKTKALIKLIPAYNQLTQMRFDQEFNLLKRRLAQSLVISESFLKHFNKMPKGVVQTIKSLVPLRLKILVSKALAKSIAE